MSGLEITLVAIGGVVGYMIMAILTTRLYSWASLYWDEEEFVGLLWPLSLPFTLVVLVFFTLMAIVSWGAGHYD